MSIFSFIVCASAVWFAATCKCETIFISVSQYGEDVSRCIAGTTPCYSLSYVLSALGNCSSFPLLSDVTVNIEYNAPIKASTYTFCGDLNLSINGSSLNAPSTSCVGEEILNFVSSPHTSVSVQWESMNIVNCSGPHAIGLRGLTFSNCQLLFSKGIYIEDTSYVRIVSSQFLFSEAYDKDAAFVITNDCATTRISMKDSIFAGAPLAPRETATILWVSRSLLQIKGNITFINGFGRLGGALRLTRSQVITVGNATVFFSGNRAQYGNAVYIDEITCPLLNSSSGHLSLVFQNYTRATGTAGQTVVYSDGNLENCIAGYLSYNIPDSFIRTAATMLSLNLPANFNVFPGKDILLSVSVNDYFQHAAVCSANVLLTLTHYSRSLNVSCNDPRYHVGLVCPSASLSHHSVVLYDSPSDHSALHITTGSDPAEVNLNWNVTINFVCDGGSRPEASVSFIVQTCPPLVSIYSVATRSCQCVIPILGGAHFLCSIRLEVFCVENGYWAGLENDVFVVLPCDLPYCVRHSSFCPMNGMSSYHRLTRDPDHQCATSHGGLLCKGCRDGHFFTHYPLQCVSSCSVAFSSVILFVSVLVHALKPLVVFRIILSAIKNGRWYQLNCLYSSFVYLQIVGTLPLSYMPQYRALRVLLSIMKSVNLPLLDIFGEIPVCFFPSVAPLGISAFRYIEPLVALVLLAVVRLCCPSRAKLTLPKSISIFVVWPMWSIFSISVDILKCVDIGSFDGSLRVMVQPDIECFSGPHLPWVAIATLLLCLLVVPCCVTFIVSLLPCKKNVLRGFFLQGFLLCYRDRYQWFSLVYVVLWLLVACASEVSSHYLDTNILLLIIVSSVHYLLWPYKDELHNRLDMATLLNLLVVTSLIRQQTTREAEDPPYVSVCVYIFVSAQLICNGINIATMLGIDPKRFLNKVLFFVVRYRKSAANASNADATFGEFGASYVHITCDN